MAVTTRVPTDMTFGKRGYQSKDDFVSTQEAGQDKLSGEFSININDMADEFNNLADDVTALEQSTQDAKNKAVEGAIISEGAANYKGDWDSDTTYGIGESTTYNGSIMYSKIADNTTEPTDKTTTTEWLYKPSGANYTDIKDANYDAVSGDFIYCNTVTNGSFTVTLPSSPALNDTVKILDIKAGFEDNNLTIARNGNNIMGLDEDMLVDKNNASLSLIFIDSNWRIF